MRARSPVSLASADERTLDYRFFAIGVLCDKTHGFFFSSRFAFSRLLLFGEQVPID